MHHIFPLETMTSLSIFIFLVCVKSAWTVLIRTDAWHISSIASLCAKAVNAVQKLNSIVRIFFILHSLLTLPQRGSRRGLLFRNNEASGHYQQNAYPLAYIHLLVEENDGGNHAEYVAQADQRISFT